MPPGRCSGPGTPLGWSFPLANAGAGSVEPMPSLDAGSGAASGSGSGVDGPVARSRLPGAGRRVRAIPVG